jgi:hypothetical protein
VTPNITLYHKAQNYAICNAHSAVFRDGCFVLLDVAGVLVAELTNTDAFVYCVNGERYQYDIDEVVLHTKMDEL